MLKNARLIILFCILNFFKISVLAQVLAYEGFDYFNSANVDLHNANLNSSGNPKNGKTILGWAGDWVVSSGAGSGYDISSNNSLQYTDGSNYLINAGHYMEGGDIGGATVGRRLQTSSAGFFGNAGLTTSAANPTTTNFVGLNGTTLWFGFVVNKIIGNSDPVYISLHKNANEYDVSSGNSIKIGYFGGTQFWGLNLNGTVTQSAKAISPNAPTLLVVSITFNSGSGNIVSLYVNPTGIGGAAPGSPDLAGTTGAVDNTFNSIAIAGGNSAGQSQFDEIRFGKNFSDATLSSNQVKILSGLCSGTYGDNIFTNGDFGKITGVNEFLATDTNWVKPTKVTFKTNNAPWNLIAPGYTYDFNTTINDGIYTIATGVRDIYSYIRNPLWITSQDNSPTQDGFMMVVNSDFIPRVFYSQTINGICQNTKYEFSLDAINLYDKSLVSITNPSGANLFYFPKCDTVLEPGCQQFSSNASSINCPSGVNCTQFSVSPQIEFQIGGIPVYSPPFTIPNDNKWHKVGFTFYTLPGITSLVLSINNTAPGGIGNDIGLDNITFKPCGPNIPLTSSIPVCKPAMLKANVIGTEFDTPVYQWQKLDTTVSPRKWVNIASATNSTYYPVKVDSLFYIRAVVANSPTNISDTNCRVITASQKIFCNPGGFPLPVSLIYFNAQRQSEKVLLQWQTGFEKDNLSFEIQRSLDGKTFTTIGTVEGSGNSNSYINYIYFDNEPGLGINYYRLKQNNEDDTFTYSKVIAVRIDGLALLYPNPARDIVKITFGKSNKLQEKIILKVLNNIGVIVKYETILLKNSERQCQLQISDLPSGIYFIEIHTEEEKLTKKLIITD